MKFSYIDILLFGGLGLAVYLGYRGGFTKKIFNVLALLGSIVIATQLMNPLGGLLIEYTALTEPLGYVVGFGLVVAVLMVATILLYRRFGKVSVIKGSSQVLGITLGLLEGSMMISLILLGLKVFDSPDKSTRTSSLLYKPLVNFAPKTFDLLRSYLPGASDFKEELSKTFKQSDIFESLSETSKKL